MIWAAEIFISVWFGYELVSLLARNLFDMVQRFFAGIPIGLFSFAWLMFIFSSYHKLDSTQLYLPFLILLALSIYLHRVNSRLRLSTIVRFEFIQFWTLVIGGIFYVYLMYLSMLYQNTQTKGAGYGDLPFHMNIVSSFSCGCNNNRNAGEHGGFYNVMSVFFAGERLAYPFMTNFLAGSLIATGRATLRAALFFPSAFIIVSFLYGQYSLSYKFTKDHFATLLSVILFANLGGLGWVKYVTDPNHGYGDWIHNWGKNQYEYWFHPLFHIIVPQRASLWSMPFCYWAMYSLILAVEHKKWRMFLLAAIFTGFTPLIQIHSFVSIAQWSITYCLITFPFTKPKRKWVKWIKFWAIFGIVANVIAFPQFFPYFNRLSTAKSQFLQLNPIWNSREKKPFGFMAPFVLWWRGLGVFWAIACIVGFSCLTVQQIKYYAPSLVVYLIANFVRYQPWELDNTKMFYAGWLPMALPVVGQFLARLSRNSATLIIFFVLMFSCCYSSFIHSVDCLVSKSQIFDQKDFDFGLWVAENTNTKSVFLTSDWHVHPAAVIAGRQLLMGYGGWVSSHGLDYWGHNELVNQMKNSPKNIAEYVKRNVSYVISRNNEMGRFEKERNSTLFREICSMNGYRVFRFNVSGNA